MISRGIRDHNPGNLEDSGIAWLGMVGRDDQGYCIFDTALHGLRACALDIHTKWKKDHLDTIAKIITVYAPPKDNDTPAYIAAISAAMTVKPDDPIDLSQVNPLAQFVRAVVLHENGTVPYDGDLILAATQQALDSGE